MEPENNIKLEGMFDVWATQCLNPCTFSISFSDLAAREKKVCIFSGKIPNSKHIVICNTRIFCFVIGMLLSNLGYIDIY